MYTICTKCLCDSINTGKETEKRMNKGAQIVEKSLFFRIRYDFTRRVFGHLEIGRRESFKKMKWS